MRGRPPKVETSNSPRIWLDADGAPAAAVEAACRYAHEARVMLTLVASRPQSCPNSAFVRSVVLAPGNQVVSGRIAGVLGKGDVVVTLDKALVSTAGEKKATALDPHKGLALAGLLEEILGKKPVPAAP